MTLADVLVDVWRQALVEELAIVRIAGEPVAIRRTPGRGLRTLAFTFEHRPIEAIEQNPERPSRWGELAREGKRILQFSCQRRYFANVCEGTLTRYPAWRGLELPD